MQIDLQTIISDSILEEKRTRDVIVVDVQPMYENWIKFDLDAFSNFLLKNRRILFFYNGPMTVGEDTKETIIEWLYEHAESEELYNKLMSDDTIWIDKGYGFFRSWMDEGVDAGFLQKAVRFMMEQGVYDSRDIENDEWEERFPEDFTDNLIHDSINLPDISIGDLKTWSGSYITGGGSQECLKEVQILMNAFNIKYTEVADFIF